MVLGCCITSKAKPLDEAAFRALTNTRARKNFLLQEFLPTDKKAFLRLLPDLENKNDHQSTLFWHYRYYVSKDSFQLTTNELKQQLMLMQNKAIRFGDSVALIVSKVNQLILQHKQKEISLIQLFKRTIPYYEKMRSIGFSNFVDYDLNFMIAYSTANLWTYWGTDQEDARKYLKVAEQNTSHSALSQQYQSVTLSGLLGGYLQEHNMPKYYEYAWRIYHTNQKLNPELNQKGWQAGYWQVIALTGLAIMHHEDKHPEAHDHVKKALSIYKKLNITDFKLERIRLEARVLNELAISLTNLNYLKEVPSLLTRLDSVTKLLAAAGEEKSIR